MPDDDGLDPVLVVHAGVRFATWPLGGGAVGFALDGLEPFDLSLRGLQGNEWAVVDAGPNQRLVSLDQQATANSPTFARQSPKKVVVTLGGRDDAVDLLLHAERSIEMNAEEARAGFVGQGLAGVA